MTQGGKRLAQLAIAIHQQLTLQHSTALAVDLPTAAWSQCEKLLLRIPRARECGWSLAAPARSAARTGLMVHQFSRWLRGIRVEFDTTLNPLAGELAVA